MHNTIELLHETIGTINQEISQLIVAKESTIRDLCKFQSNLEHLKHRRERLESDLKSLYALEDRPEQKGSIAEQPNQLKNYGQDTCKEESSNPNINAGKLSKSLNHGN